jgi:hypothetical protein
MAEARPIQLKRHCRELSPGEIDELVAAAADLIVDFLMKRRDPGQSEEEVPA